MTDRHKISQLLSSFQWKSCQSVSWNRVSGQQQAVRTPQKSIQFTSRASTHTGVMQNSFLSILLLLFMHAFLWSYETLTECLIRTVRKTDLRMQKEITITITITINLQLCFQKDSMQASCSSSWFCSPFSVQDWTGPVGFNGN